MEIYRTIFVILAVVTVSNGAWLAKTWCNPATNATQNKGTAINGNCFPQYDGSYLLYTCGPEDQTAVEFSCSDSKCTQCAKTASYQTTGECMGEEDSYMYACFPKDVDYAKVAGTPSYFLQNTLMKYDCSGQPLQADYYSVGACIPGRNKDVAYPYFMQFDSPCSATSATLNMYLDPYCSTKPIEFIDVPLNKCTNYVQSVCYMK